MNMRRNIEAWGPLGKPPEAVLRCGRGSHVWKKWLELSKDARWITGTVSEKRHKQEEVSERKRQLIKMAERMMNDDKS
tara:strand:+ start:398 stop:631 length:234 start_codon:yes stop_codon:yes gene_type:complete